MSWDFKQFQDEINDYVENEIPTKFKRRQIEIILFIYRRVQHYTPVHDPTLGRDPHIPGGHARNNWRVGTYIKDDVLGTRENPGSPIDEETFRTELSGMRAGETLYVYNNVRYIQALEDGNSIDPSKGYMVSQAIEETKDYIMSRGW